MVVGCLAYQYLLAKPFFAATQAEPRKVAEVSWRVGVRRAHWAALKCMLPPRNLSGVAAVAAQPPI